MLWSIQNKLSRKRSFSRFISRKRWSSIIFDTSAMRSTDDMLVRSHVCTTHAYIAYFLRQQLRLRRRPDHS
jgi:hypothetical protein